MMRYILIITYVIFSLVSCVPPSKEIKSDVKVDLSIREQQKIVDFQDQMMVDSIWPYLKSDDPTHIYLSIRAFASLDHTAAVDSLLPFLNHPNMDIRTMTAYALGQLNQSKATEYLISNFIAEDTLDVDNTYNANILEALGKISNKSIMNNIATVESYRPDDTLLILGQNRSLYRFALRNIINQEAIQAVVKYVNDNSYPTDSRIIAANYLARNKDLDLEIHRDNLLQTLKKEKNPFIRMGLALGMRNLYNDPTLSDELLDLLNTEKDYRVRCYLIKALYAFPYIKIIEPLMTIIKNEQNIHVSQSAAQYLVDKGNGPDAYLYRELIQEDMPWQTKAKIFEAVMKHTPIYYTRVKRDISKDIIEQLEKEDNLYAKGAFIKALSQDPYQYKTLLDLQNTVKEEIVHTAIAEGLKTIVNSPTFFRAFGGNQYRIARSICDSLIVHSKKGYSGTIVHLAHLIKNEDYDWKRLIRDTSWREDIIKSLKLPEKSEAFNEFKTAITALDGGTYTPPTPDFTHPIDWTLLSTVSDSSRLVLKTSKGNITMELFKDDAPGSVTNFVKLCQSDYYDGKVFHRVVPNFVIQGGCPVGDGYGSLDYNIRSEFSPKYYDDEGYVGMASMGKHTEGVQFFITHSPTPHLDGKYTIFAKVTDGMEVVHSIEPGDRIIDAILTSL